MVEDLLEWRRLLASGGYFYRIYVFQTFGLGAPDMARLFDPAGDLVDSYSWTTHATGTYGRCPDGTGPFVDSTPTPGAPNACGGGGAGGAGGAAGMGGAGGMGGLPANEFPWPGTDTVITVDDVGEWASNLSGLSYQPATAIDPAVLWGIDNGPSKLYRLLWNGTTWESDPANSWGAGKTIHYLDGTGDPDSEGVSKAEFADTSIYVSTERDNDNNQVNRFSVLRYDTSASGTDLTAQNDWELTPDLPAMGINLGLEAITYVPDTALVAGGFFDEAANATYTPASYPNHGTGLFFVGLESNGVIYGYALNHADKNTFTRVATFASGQVSIMDLSYDREVGYLWAQCDNTCGVKATVFRLDTTPTSHHRGPLRDRPRLRSPRLAARLELRGDRHRTGGRVRRRPGSTSSGRTTPRSTVTRFAAAPSRGGSLLLARREARAEVRLSASERTAHHGHNHGGRASARGSPDLSPRDCQSRSERQARE